MTVTWLERGLPLTLVCLTLASCEQPTAPVTPVSPLTPAAASVLPSAGAHAIRIDATSLSAPYLNLVIVAGGGGQFATGEVVDVNLDPGQHLLGYSAGASTRTLGVIGDRGSVPLSVTTDGAIDYPATLDGMLAGRGTSTLTVIGAAVAIDASPLSATFVGTILNGAVFFDESGPTHLTLLPGLHHMSYATANNTRRGPRGDVGAVEFTVLEDGTFDYNPALEGILVGGGTSSLVAHGAAVTVDVAALSASGIATQLGGSVPLEGAPTLKLLPGEHLISYPTGRNTFTHGPVGEVGTLTFNVQNDATVAYDAVLEGILSGAGTAALAVKGAEIHVDVSALTAIETQIRRGDLGSIPDVTDLRLLPGYHFVGYNTAINLLDFPSTVGDIGVAEFDVLPDGTIDYEPVLNAILSGRGSSSLNVVGATITLDLSRLDADGLSTRVGLDVPFGSGGIPVVDGITSVTLLPGPHEIHYTSASGSIGGMPFVEFSVDAAALVDFDPSFDLVMGGRGTSIVEVRGSAVQIDATCVDPVVYPNFSVVVLGTFPTSEVHTLTLLPGSHRVDLWNIISVFRLGRDGLVDYDPVYEASLGGRGTDLLVLKTPGPECNDTEAPLVSGVAADPNPVEVNAGLALAASVDDAATGGSVVVAAEYAIDGEGFIAMNASDGSFDGITEPVIASIPAFSAAGVHDMCVRGTDAAGNVSETQCILLAVYDPSAGFVTGAGWIDSPPGAYAPDPSLTGKATFGFVSRYQTRAMVPDGQTQFKFKVADVDFSSSSYEWLVIAGARAQYKGSGTVNGMGDYGFMLTAIDGEINGGGGLDKFRMKIWDKATGTVVYDNQVGEGDSADPTTAIGGGSIVIHK